MPPLFKGGGGRKILHILSYRASFLSSQAESPCSTIYRSGCFIQTRLTTGALNTGSLASAGLVLTITTNHTAQSGRGTVGSRWTVQTVSSIGVLAILKNINQNATP